MLDRRTPPVFHTDFSYPLIHPTKHKLSSGALLHVLSAGSQEVVKLELVFNAGKWYEEKPGQSQLTSNMLSKGTIRKSGQEIIQSFDQLGVHYDVTSGFDFVTISLYGLPENVTKVLPLLVELVMEANFPPEELEVLKGQFAQSLKINLEKNSYVAGCLSRESLFGRSHPYGINLNVSDIEEMQTSDLVNFHKNRFSLHTSILSGHVDSKLERSVMDAIGQIRKDESPTRQFNSRGTTEMIHRDKEGSVQTSIRMAMKTIQRTHSDYPAMLLLNHALGGYFGSRLMTNIREEKGLTYGIYSSVQSLKNESYFSIGTDVKKENKEAAIHEIQSEVLRLGSETISIAEFQTLKNHFVGSFQTELSTPFAHAEKGKAIVLHELNPQFFNNLLSRINDLTPGDLIECAKKHLDVSALSIVSVG